MVQTTRRRIRAGTALFMAVPLAAAFGAPTAMAQDAESMTCVPSDPATPISFQLNFTAGGYNAPFALAELEGYYDDVGLNVDIVKGQGSGTTARLVASGQAGLAYADSSAVAQVIAQGAEIKILSTIYQSSPNAINALAESGIESVADLEGRTLGEPIGESGSALLSLLLEANGLTRDDLDIVPMPGTSLVGALTQGQVDAILGSTEGYNLVLEEQGFDVSVLPYAEWGVPTISTSMLASERFLEENANAVRCFIEASLKGWDEAIKRPDDAIAALVEYFPFDTRPDLNARQLESAIDLVCANDAQFVGKAEPEAWENSVKIWQDNFGLSLDVPATEYYSYDFLPETLPTACPLEEMAG